MISIGGSETSRTQTRSENKSCTALFEEAGCSGEHLTEQPVKHSHDPNVICALPGQSDAQIVVGGHFDFVDRGQGVVDNWSGCSLLPSLYQSLKSFSADAIRSSSSLSRTKRREWLDRRFMCTN